MRADIKTGTISGAGAAATSSKRQGAGVLLPGEGDSSYVRRPCRSHRHRFRCCSHVAGAAPLTSPSRRADAATSGLATLTAWRASVVSR
jgi:hypothetical protein